MNKWFSWIVLGLGATASILGVAYLIFVNRERLGVANLPVFTGLENIANQQSRGGRESQYQFYNPCNLESYSYGEVYDGLRGKISEDAYSVMYEVERVTATGETYVYKFALMDIIGSDVWFRTDHKLDPRVLLAMLESIDNGLTTFSGNQRKAIFGQDLGFIEIGNEIAGEVNSLLISFNQINSQQNNLVVDKFIGEFFESRSIDSANFLASYQKLFNYDPREVCN